MSTIDYKCFGRASNTYFKMLPRDFPLFKVTKLRTCFIYICLVSACAVEISKKQQNQIVKQANIANKFENIFCCIQLPTRGHKLTMPMFSNRLVPVLRFKT